MTRVGTKGKPTTSRTAASARDDAESERRRVPIAEAIQRIGGKKAIHTFMQTGPMLIGADHPRTRLIAAMRRHGVEDSGESASKMGHTLVIVAYPTLDGRTTPLFIEAQAADAVDPHARTTTG